MDIKVLLMTFGMIFLAELGDKTAHLFSGCTSWVRDCQIYTGKLY